MPQPLRIALLMGQDSSFCRGILRGIRCYALHQKNWIFRNGPPQPDILGPLREWKPHGIIGHLFDAEIARAVMRMRRPVVDVACTLPRLKAPIVDVDHTAIGRLAAEHFLERGFPHYAFFGSGEAEYAKMRQAAFRERLAEAGHEVLSCHAEYVPHLPATASWRETDKKERQWLKGLPKPVAILAANDVPARDVTDICRQLGFDVPDEVAVLGVDNDEVECGLADPPLSSIAIPAERIGHVAAELLDRMMAGEEGPRQTTFLPPVRVVTRQSTDTLAISDPAVAEALRFIRQHATDEDFHVGDVVTGVAHSRRLLEIRFRELLGRTVLQEIRRIRVEIAKGLLMETSLSMPAIARRAGFPNAARLCIVFRKVTGLTPTAYRQQALVTEGRV